jgi:KipI family sensor histidine kinase inhibitor
VIEVLPAGRDALLVDLGSAAGARRAYRAIMAAVETGTMPRPRDVVPAARTVLVVGVSDADLMARVIRSYRDDPGVDQAGRLIELEVTFDGPDLADVGRHWRCDVDEVVARVRGTAYEVGFTGFTPGFAYLLPDGGWTEVPRRQTPRARVPAGSVGLAGPYCGVYPRATPGGWQLVGRTDAVLFDPQRTDPALLHPGHRVRFVDRG